MLASRPPGSPRNSYRTGKVTGTDPDEWLANSTENPGSWWEHWNHWIEEHTPGKRPAPPRPGSDSYPPLGEAPGDYIRRVLG